MLPEVGERRSVEAFQSLCKLICDVCALTIPLSHDEYRLHTDTSLAGIGAVLSIVRELQEWSVAFFSKQLHGAEQNYTASS